MRGDLKSSTLATALRLGLAAWAKLPTKGTESMKLKPDMFKVGDKVRNKISGDQGTVLVVRAPHTRDCALVRFDSNPGGDNYTIPWSQLEKVAT
jgi:hypothetical protein